MCIVSRLCFMLLGLCCSLQTSVAGSIAACRPLVQLADLFRHVLRTTTAACGHIYGIMQTHM